MSRTIASARPVPLAGCGTYRSRSWDTPAPVAPCCVARVPPFFAALCSIHSGPSVPHLSRPHATRRTAEGYAPFTAGIPLLAAYSTWGKLLGHCGNDLEMAISHDAALEVADVFVAKHTPPMAAKVGDVIAALTTPTMKCAPCPCCV